VNLFDKQEAAAESSVANEPRPPSNRRPCFTELHGINVEANTMRLKFCQIDPKIYERYTNEDTKVLRKVKVCDQCRKYLMKQESPKYNQDWSIMWPSFIWRFLPSPLLRSKLGIKVRSIVPTEWRRWWLPRLKELFSREYRNILSIEYRKAVIRDATCLREQADKLVKELKTFARNIGT
jgi:hypothetical protein